MVDVTLDAQMLPMLPCVDIDEVATFWTALGLRVTYRQVRPNPYVALERNGICLHYYGMPGHRPEDSHSTCGLIVSDTEPLHDLFAEGFRSLFGQVRQNGTPRMTRPRQRANNAGLSGFSVIDPAGNWIRVSRRPATGEQVRSVDDRLEWTSAGTSPLARALENAVVQGDSHGDAGQAHRILAGALGREPDAPAGVRAEAWAYLAELRVRLDDLGGARQAASEVTALAAGDGLAPADTEAVNRALGVIADLKLETSAD